MVTRRWLREHAEAMEREVDRLRRDLDREREARRIVDQALSDAIAERKGAVERYEAMRLEWSRAIDERDRLRAELRYATGQDDEREADEHGGLGFGGDSGTDRPAA